MVCYKCGRVVTEIRKMIVNRKNKDGSRSYVIACADCSAADAQKVRYRKANNIILFDDPRYDLPFPYVKWGIVLDACNYTCSICGKSGKMVIDHIVPLSRGGTNDIENLQPLCHSCNVKKRNYTMEEFMEKQKNKHAVALGKLGGKKNTDAQNTARAANGKRGGRPRTRKMYHVVRLDLGIKNGDGAYHQTHHFSQHLTLTAAVKKLLAAMKSYNCVGIVDDAGFQVDGAQIESIIYDLNEK